MRQLTIAFDFDDETIVAFADWLGKPAGIEPLAYIIERLKEPFLDHVVRFQTAMRLQASAQEIEAAVQDAAAKLQVLPAENP